ncbi:MAG TPA: hypothetical protein VJ521_14745, partial [Acidobacteriota bacterium]|nr:hypothetical protein [Acidobacteriota bacterium]
LRLDSAGEIQQLHLQSERPEGSGDLQVLRKGSTLYITAHFPEQQQWQSNDLLPPEMDFSASMVAGRLPFFSKIKSLALDASVEKKLKELDLTVFFNREQKFVESTWSIHRDGDISRNFLGQTKSASTFTLRRSWNQIVETGALLLDDQDLPLLYERGWRTYERIE